MTVPGSQSCRWRRRAAQTLQVPLQQKHLMAPDDQPGTHLTMLVAWRCASRPRADQGLGGGVVDEHPHVSVGAPVAAQVRRFSDAEEPPLPLPLPLVVPKNRRRCASPVSRRRGVPAGLLCLHREQWDIRGFGAPGAGR